MGDANATDAAFSRAARVVTLELVNNRVVVNSMEPRNAIADFDPASGRSTLYTATQGPHFVRDPLAEAVLAQAERVHVVALAARYRLPAVYPFRRYVSEGGLISYGSDQIEPFRRAVSGLAP